jgi:hypothetical protein
MNRLILAVGISTAALSACSDNRERNVPVVEQPDRPLQVARPDSSDTVRQEIASSQDQSMSSVEQQPPRLKPAKARPAPRPRKRVAPAPRPKADTNAVTTGSVRGYAPASRSNDSTPVPDTTVANDTVARADTSSAQSRDTVGGLTADSVASRQALTPDSVTAGQADTTTTQRTTAASDSAMPSRVSGSDTALASGGVRASDTTSTADSGPAPRPATRPAVANAAEFDAARRTLPIGTEIHAALNDSITSRRDTAGRNITAEITQSVTGAGGKVLISAGSTVRLTVTRIAAARSKSSQGRLRLKVDGVEVGGQLQNVQADLKPVPRELRGRGVTGSEAAKVGAGAAGGAVVGGVIGGNTKGAVIGGVIGAAGGAVVASQTATRDVVVKAKTPVTFVLTAPLVTP